MATIDVDPLTSTRPLQPGADATSLGRVGFAAKGLVYGVMALLTARLAMGQDGGQDAGARGAIATLAEQPFGRWLVAATGVGLLAYGAWRAWTVASGRPDHDAVPDWVVRVGWAGSALFNLALGGWATWTAVQGGATSSGGAAGGSSSLLNSTAGVIAVVALGVVFLGVGLSQAKQAMDGDVVDHLPRSVRGDLGDLAKRLGVAGHGGRALVFGLLGVFLVQSGLTSDTGEATGGLDAALRDVRDTSFGLALLLAVTVGLAAYAAWCAVVAAKGRPAE